MKAEELLIRLGKVTANAQVFELLTYQVLGACLGIDNDLAFRLGGRMNTDALLGLVEELVVSGKPKLQSDELRAWIKAARQANEARNRVIHSAWHGDPETSEMLGVLNKRKAAFETRTAEELQKDHKIILTAIEGASKLLKLGTATENSRNSQGR